MNANSGLSDVRLRKYGRLAVVILVVHALATFSVRANELDLLDLTGVIRFGDTVRVSLSHKQSGHLGWIEIGQQRSGIEIVSAKLSPPAAATVSNGSSVKEIQLKEAKVRPLNIAQSVRSRPKSEAEISFDATMMMSYERSQELRRERERKRRDALLLRQSDS
ncbi:hypothetical protein [Pelagicoccus sp. SDUM812002]|uniref:hypothetical protein n=1 Tax=Pelagicoccus sp. SDUM812002 TaxID=3041266 RepID=UPI00280C9688|nr:hypothetical protein [Pelagicoccus sp. SDUM812002]MDQ8184862.1 hypothetical protein [Pelagicoccus sp. SDUM812002]